MQVGPQSVNPQHVADFDPQAEMVALAARLVAVHEADPANMAAAKELRQVLAVIPPAGVASPPVGRVGQVAFERVHGWRPGDDPGLLALAEAMAAIDPMAYLRALSDRVP